MFGRLAKVLALVLRPFQSSALALDLRHDFFQSRVGSVADVA